MKLLMLIQESKLVCKLVWRIDEICCSVNIKELDCSYCCLCVMEQPLEMLGVQGLNERLREELRPRILLI